MPFAMERVLQEVSEQFFLANAKVAEVESLGMDFPEGSLYSIFGGFDSIAAVDGGLSDNPDVEAVVEGVDQASAMLLAAYFYASLEIGSYYFEQIENFDNRWKGLKLDRYSDYDVLKSLEERRKEADQAARAFESTLDEYPDDDILQIFDELKGLSKEGRLEYLLKVNEWASSRAELHKAQKAALFVYEKANSARNTRLTVCSWVIRILGALLLIPSIWSIYMSCVAILQHSIAG